MANCVYICSAGHSGSTLLDLLIGSHSRAASLGEITQLPKNISLNTLCSCGSKVRSCEVWQDIIHKLNNKLNIDIINNPYSLNLGYFKAVTVVDKSRATKLHDYERKLMLGINYLDLHTKKNIFMPFLSSINHGIKNKFTLYDLFADVLNVALVVDSSKNYLDATNLYKYNSSKVKVILLTRDGRAVFYSGLKRGFSRSSALVAWETYYRRAVPILKDHVAKDDLLWVRYENLVSDPSNELKKICRFLNITYEESMLDFAEKVHHSTNGNNMRFAKTSKIKLDNAWKESLTQNDLSYFNSKASTLNTMLGYE
jgi:hypothetical protein